MQIKNNWLTCFGALHNHQQGSTIIHSLLLHVDVTIVSRVHSTAYNKDLCKQLLGRIFGSEKAEVQKGG